MSRSRFSVRALTINALLLALGMAFLFLASFVPAVELSLQVLASFCIAAAIVEIGIGGGVLLYAALFLLAFTLLPNKAILLPFFFFFGPYPCFKDLIERVNNKFLRMLFKLVIFNSAFWGAWTLFRGVLLGSSYLPDIPLWFVIVALQPVFLLYDHVLTLAVIFYNHRIRRKA